MRTRRRSRMRRMLRTQRGRMMTRRTRIRSRMSSTTSSRSRSSTVVGVGIGQPCRPGKTGRYCSTVLILCEPLQKWKNGKLTTKKHFVQLHTKISYNSERFVCRAERVNRISNVNNSAGSISGLRQIVSKIWRSVWRKLMQNIKSNKLYDEAFS